MAVSAMDRYKEQGYNPFAPATINGGGAMDAVIPQIDMPAGVPISEQESTMDKVSDVAVQKGGDYAADKGGDMLSNALAAGKGGGATTAPAMVGRAGLSGYGPGLAAASGGTVAAGGGAAAGGAAAGAGMAGLAAAAAPILPFVIGAMALKSFFKK
jgi:hypothetical protein